MSLGKRLKEARIAKGLSQSELADAAGIHYTQIGRYENKGAQPTADVLSRIANTLEISSDFLMSGSTEQLAGSHLTDKELLNQFKQVEALPERDKGVIKELIDAFLTKKKIQQLAG